LLHSALCAKLAKKERKKERKEEEKGNVAFVSSH
jgi:hypothetical protein